MVEIKSTDNWHQCRYLVESERDRLKLTARFDSIDRLWLSEKGRKSKQKLLAALKREVTFWKTEYCWEIECGVEAFADYPRSWSRLLCVEVIRMLLEETLEIFDSIGLDSGLEFCDESLEVLRTRLADAVRIKPVSLLPARKIAAT